MSSLCGRRIGRSRSREKPIKFQIEGEAEQKEKEAEKGVQWTKMIMLKLRMKKKWNKDIQKLIDLFI